MSPFGTTRKHHNVNFKHISDQNTTFYLLRDLFERAFESTAQSLIIWLRFESDTKLVFVRRNSDLPHIQFLIKR